MQNVFLSHSSKDKPIVREIALFLTSEGISVWFDEWDISPGESIPEKVSEALANCSHFLLIWSKNAEQSAWVKRELYPTISRMISEQKIKVIPIILDKTALPTILSDIKYIKYSGGTEQDRYCIVKTITGNAASGTYVEAVVKKYREVIYDDESSEPLAFKACPYCGGTRLDYFSQHDWEHDEMYYFVSCKDCNWREWTQ